MEGKQQILDAINESRNASRSEHQALRAIVENQNIAIANLIEDLQGNEKRNIEGIMPQVKRHEKLLKPLQIVADYPKGSVVIIVIALHIIGTFSIYGIGKLLSLF